MKNVGVCILLLISINACKYKKEPAPIVDKQFSVDTAYYTRGVIYTNGYNYDVLSIKAPDANWIGKNYNGLIGRNGWNKYEVDLFSPRQMENHFVFNGNTLKEFYGHSHFGNTHSFSIMSFHLKFNDFHPSKSLYTSNDITGNIQVKYSHTTEMDTFTINEIKMMKMEDNKWIMQWSATCKSKFGGSSHFLKYHLLCSE